VTDTQSALLRAVAIHPAEDTPRLVYADFLDELNEPSATARAEFIRLHVRAARLTRDAPEREPIVRRIDQLLCAWDVVWQKEMPVGFRALSGYHSGFSYRAAAAASAVAGATEDPRLLFIEHLELTADVPAPRFRTLVRLPLFAQLTDLIVVDGPLTASGARALVAGEYPRLERLVLARQALGDSGIEALSESRNFPRLRVLDVCDNGITTAGLTAFRSSRFYTRLQRVLEGGNGLPWG
jgi:uncharacterized protein (TIGR02996 family)